jgi:phosphopantothenoylcysteine decarboxylase / phosphopantothenate---cysteine ligase
MHHIRNSTRNYGHDLHRARHPGVNVIASYGQFACPALATPFWIPPGRIDRVNVTSAAEMLAAIEANVNEADIFIAVAAVADYRPSTSAEQKIKKKDAALTLELEPTVDILAKIAKHARTSNDPEKNGTPPYCVGFAAESENVEQYGSEKRRRKGIPLLIANHAMSTFGADENQATLISASTNQAQDEIKRLPRMNKIALARSLANRIALAV